MFRQTIKEALKYTRPFITGKLYYENRNLINDISTMIVLNKNGDILTTAHTADLIFSTEEINEVFYPILKEIASSSKKQIKNIEKKYGIMPNTLVGLHNIIVDIANNPGKLQVIKHKYLDMAIIKIENKEELLIKEFPKFYKGIPEVGTSICNIGFALPEYKAFAYDEENSMIKTTNELMNFPIFPLDNMICRNIADQENKVSMFETSKEALPGQDGGPVLNQDGQILGMLVNTKVITNSLIKDFNIKLGIAINSNTIIEFLRENDIEYEVYHDL